MSVKTVITICSSANFYRQAIEIQKQLEEMGFRVIIPATAEKMKKSGNFEVNNYKTWLDEPNDYHIKASLMRGHFKEVEIADAILVLNYEKHGVLNYIGGNVLMEMALAFYLGKPIFIMNGIPKESVFLEEIIGLGPITLNGRVESLPELYKNLITKG
jgi:hypothetical protein